MYRRLYNRSCGIISRCDSTLSKNYSRHQSVFGGFSFLCPLFSWLWRLLITSIPRFPPPFVATWTTPRVALSNIISSFYCLLGTDMHRWSMRSAGTFHEACISAVWHWMKLFGIWGGFFFFLFFPGWQQGGKKQPFQHPPATSQAPKTNRFRLFFFL